MQEEQPKTGGIAAVGVPDNGVLEQTLVYQTDQPGTYKVPYQRHDGLYGGHCDFHIFNKDQPKIEKFFYPEILEELLRIHKETGS